MTDLMREHKAIRMQMKFLANSLSSLAMQSVQVKDRIWRYGQGLLDFQEMVRRHIKLDERIFKTVVDSTSIEDMIREHEEIKKRVNSAIQLADNAVENKLSQEELNQCALNIIESINRICELIEAHTAKEDRLLKPVQKDS